MRIEAPVCYRLAVAGRLIALVVLLVVGWSRPAQGADPASDRRAQARAAYEQAEKAAAELRFAEALAGYQRAIRIDPAAPFIRIARVREADLKARSEGDFHPLARLEAVRRDAQKRASRPDIEALERDIAAFPDGPVRSEARLLVAEAFQHRLGEPTRAIEPLEALLADHSAPVRARILALNALVTLHRGLGDLDAARDAVERWPDVAPDLRTEVLRLVRRVRLRWASIVALLLLAGVGGASLVRAARRQGGMSELTHRAVRPMAVAFALYLGAGAALLTRLHGGGDPRPFLWLGLGVLGVDIIARAWAVVATHQSVAARLGRAVACAVCVLAVAFLSLERADAGYLESFGL